MVKVGSVDARLVDGQQILVGTAARSEGFLIEVCLEEMSPGAGDTRAAPRQTGQVRSNVDETSNR